MYEVNTKNPDIEGSAPAKSSPLQPLERTAGLKLVDKIIYPLVNNVGVFVISVGATFLTSHGHEVAKSFENKGFLANGVAWVCHGMEDRGDWLKEQFKKVKIEGEAAEMAKMVTFSFADGCLMAPFVKILEDNRGNIARKIDNVLGTTPENEEVYDAELKQSWGSVLGGRFLTAGIVVPTAVILEKTGANNLLFTKASEVMAEQFAKYRPEDVQRFGMQQVTDLSKIAVFEAFYTSVCTYGLYQSSRFLAEHFPNKTTSEKVDNEYSAKQIVKNYDDFAPIMDLYGKNVNIENGVIKEVLAENNIKPFKQIKSHELSFDGKAGAVQPQLISV